MAKAHTEIVNEDDIVEIDVDESFLENLRNDCVAQIKAIAELNRRDRVLQVQGEYSEVQQQDFLKLSNKTRNVVAHFCKSDVLHCNMFDRHLKLLAKKHTKTRFLKLDAERNPLLTKHFNIEYTPSLLLITDRGTKEKVVSFSILENCDDFSTEILEWYLGTCGVIAPIPTTPEMQQKIKAMKLDNLQH